MTRDTDIATVDLAPGYTIPRVIIGNWQLAGGHGHVAQDEAVRNLMTFADAGFTAYDGADIYTGVEEILGRFTHEYRARGATAGRALRVHTKCVPDLDMLPVMTRQHLEAIIDRSLRRLRTERLDLVQFHWWDFDIPGHVDAARHLADMQRAGKIHLLGVTNYDQAHLDELLDAGVPVATNQVQVSLLDARALRTLTTAPESRRVPLLAYGSVAGGFLSARWLGQPSPAEPHENRSLTKYRLIIDEYGGWEAFQALLTALAGIAQAHGVDLSTVAMRHVLDAPGVAAAILGARSTRHLASLVAALALQLTDADRARLDELTTQAPGPAGPVYALERDKGGRHAAIMRYNLNRPT